MSSLQSHQIGGRKWLECAITRRPELITNQLLLETDELLAWSDPGDTDEFANYDLIGHSRGGKLFLIAAKSHVEELFTGTAIASPDEMLTITKQLEAAKQFYGTRADANWLSPFYEYTSRLAHLHSLRVLAGVDARLLLVYFLNDTVPGKTCPRLIDGWKKVLMVLHEAIGMTGRIPAGWVHEVYLDTRELAG